MRGPGTRWRLPSGREGIEWPGSTRDVLVLAELTPGWPFPAPPREHARSLCRRARSQVQRVGGVTLGDTFEEALL